MASNPSTGRSKKRPRGIDMRWVRVTDWRTPAGAHYRRPYAPSHIRWAPGSRDTLVIESRRRRFRLCIVCPWR